MILLSDPFFIFLIFILGLITGSFLNVCITRWPEDKSVISPRSQCPKCQKTICWYDNIPILSWFFLKFRCRYCHMPISAVYPLVECVTGLGFAGIYWLLLPYIQIISLTSFLVVLLAAWLLFACTIVVSIVDMRHLIIPDQISLNLMPLGPLLVASFPELLPENLLGSFLWNFEESKSLSWTFLIPRQTVWLQALGQSLLGILIGGGCLWFLSFVGSWVFKKEAMGQGDVKLLATLGGFLGPEGVVMTLMIASILGSCLGIILWLITGNRQIPFGPWLMIGALLIFLFKWPFVLAMLNLHNNLMSFF